VRLAIRGDLLDFVADPGLHAVDSAALRHDADTWLLVEDGRIAGRSRADPGEGWERHDHRGRLVLPGFVDTHVHMPQLDVIASHGAELLDWLDTYTFPAELRYADPAVARAGAARFVDAAGPWHDVGGGVPDRARGRRGAVRGRRGARHALIAGKVLMDRHAPPRADATTSTAAAERDARSIQRWHGRGPPGLRGDGALRRHQQRPEQLAMAGAAGLHARPLHADPRGREPRRGGAGSPSCSPTRAATSTSTTATGLLHPRSGAGARHLARRRRPRAAGGQWRDGRALPDVQPVPRQRAGPTTTSRCA
jgi:guanine deaminase